MTMQSRPKWPRARSQHEQAETLSPGPPDQHRLEPRRRSVDCCRACVVHGFAAPDISRTADLAASLGLSTLGNQLPLSARLPRSAESALAELVRDRNPHRLRAVFLQPG